MYYWNGFGLGLAVNSALFFVYAYAILIFMKHTNGKLFAIILIALEFITFAVGAILMLYTQSRWK